MRGWTRACSVALLLLGGCSVAHEDVVDAASDDARSDVGTDATRGDVGTDARGDAAIGSVDAVAVDAAPPPDAFDPPDGSPWDPRWVPLADLPVRSDCDIEVALHPERLSWPAGSVTAAARIDGRDYFDLSVVNTSRSYWYRGLVDASGHVAAAFRTRGYTCWIDSLAVYGTDLGFHVTYCGCSLFGTWPFGVYRGRYDDATTYQRIATYEEFLGTDTPSAPQIALGTDLVSVIDFVGGVQIPQPDGTVRAIGYEANVTVHVGSESSS